MWIDKSRFQMALQQALVCNSVWHYTPCHPACAVNGVCIQTDFWRFAFLPPLYYMQKAFLHFLTFIQFTGPIQDWHNLSASLPLQSWIYSRTIHHPWSLRCGIIYAVGFSSWVVHLRSTMSMAPWVFVKEIFGKLQKSFIPLEKPLGFNGDFWTVTGELYPLIRNHWVSNGDSKSFRRKAKGNWGQA